MAMVHEIAAKLAALGLGSVTAGEVTIFTDKLPATPDECGAVYATRGLPAESPFGSAAIDRETPGIQVVFRGEPGDRATPRENCEAAKQGLAAIQVTTLTGGGTSALYRWIHAQDSEPILFNEDPAGRFSYSVNFMAEKEPSA